MRWLFLFLVFVIISSSSSAQSWAPPGATWHYSYYSFFIEGYIEIKYTGDSIVASKLCKVLEKKMYWYDHSQSIHDSATMGLEYTYFQNDSVFYYNNNQFYLLYDFSGQTSDVWQVAENDTACAPDTFARVQIDSIGTTIINATTLKWVSVSPAIYAYYGYEGKIMEKIGCHNFYMFPEYVACVADGNEGGPFRCYYDSTFGLYQAGATPCDFITGITPLEQGDNGIKVYPNPTTGVFTLQGATGNVEVYDLYGRLVVESDQQTIDLRQHSKGIYVVRVATGQGMVTRKVVVQ